MTTLYGGSIVTNGLVLALDAGNPKSYAGSGTTWNDLSGNGNTASMFGSVPFETDVSPCFNFSTASGSGSPPSPNSSLGFTFGANMVPTTGNFTFSCWIKNPNTLVSQTGLFSNAPGPDGYRFGVGRNAIYYLIGPTYKETFVGISFNSTLSASLWYNVVAVYSRTTAQILLYSNGQYQNVDSIPVSQTAMQNGAPGLVRSPCCNVYTGKLAQFSVYSKALSATEILQNFNATRSRFGI
jgi:hypothetical protein